MKPNPLTEAERQARRAAATALPFDNAQGRDFASATQGTAPADAEAHPAPRQSRSAPDRPVVTVTISGAPGSGKTTVEYLVLAELFFRGIATTPPVGLRSIRYEATLRDLIGRRGLRVEMAIETMPVQENRASFDYQVIERE